MGQLQSGKYFKTNADTSEEKQRHEAFSAANEKISSARANGRPVNITEEPEFNGVI